MDTQALDDAEAVSADYGVETTAANQHAETLLSRRRFRDPGLAGLALLPLVLLALDSNWIYSGPHRDAWIYFGYFQNAIFYLRHFQDLYYSSRLAVILPGFVVYHLLPPVVANFVLHLALYWAAVLSFYYVTKELFGARVALLAGLALGCHPYFLQAIGWNHPDAFGITYFLLALLFLTQASISPAWRFLLLAAGAMATAILSSNLFYGIYLPLLAGHFLVLNRQRGRIPLLPAVACVASGAVGMLLLFGSLTWMLGGEFFYFRSSLKFVSGSIGTPNIFRDPTYSWLLLAVWLVFPAVVLFGAAILLGRSRTRASLRQDRLLLWSQIQFLILLAAMLFFQVFGDTAVLEHFYYASLLIPSAFLAFAGQLRQLMDGLPDRLFTGLAAVVALLQIVPLCVPIVHSLTKDGMPFKAPVPLALFAGLGVAVAMWRKTTGMRAILNLFLCLALSQFLVRQGGTIFEQFEHHDGDGRGLFRQLSHAVTAIERFDPSQNARLWYDLDEHDGRIYDAVASAFLLCPRMIGLDFPDIQAGRMCDGVQLGPGVPIAILSADPAAFKKAATALHSIGLSAQFLGWEEIDGPSRGFALTYLRTEKGPSP